MDCRVKVQPRYYLELRWTKGLGLDFLYLVCKLVYQNVLIYAAKPSILSKLNTDLSHSLSYQVGLPLIILVYLTKLLAAFVT